MLNTYTNDETVIDAFRWSLGLVSRMLVRTILEGSTLVMKAITANNLRQLRKALSCAPRRERASWVLAVQVGTQDISPLTWSIESGNLQATEGIIKDLLSFRSDRDRYYYGCDELFGRHPDIVLKLRDFAPTVLPKLLDGLVWRSRTSEPAGRRVNFYVRHLLVNKDNSFAPALNWIAEFRDPRLVCHPIIVFLCDLIWDRVTHRQFLIRKSWLLLTLAFFLCSQSIVMNLSNPDTPLARTITFECRIFLYIVVMTEMLFRHVTQTCAAYKNNDTVTLLRVVKVPEYLCEWRETADALVGVILVAMLCMEPIIHCWPSGVIVDRVIFTADCDSFQNMEFAYRFCSSLAMFLLFSELIDLTVLSNKLSAYVLVCSRMLSECALFLSALACTIVMFACALSTLKHEEPDFQSVYGGSRSLFTPVSGYGFCGDSRKKYFRSLLSSRASLSSFWCTKYFFLTYWWPNLWRFTIRFSRTWSGTLVWAASALS